MILARLRNDSRCWWWAAETMAHIETLSPTAGNAKDVQLEGVKETNLGNNRVLGTVCGGEVPDAWSVRGGAWTGN